MSIAKEDSTLAPNDLVRSLKGIGPKKAELLAKKGIVALGDALNYFPMRYEDRRTVYSPAQATQLSEGSLISVRATIASFKEIPMRGRKQKRVELRAFGEDGSELSLIWFNSFPQMKYHYRVGREAIYTGALKYNRSMVQIVHPDVEFLEENCTTLPSSLHWGKIVPIYSSTQGLPQKTLREVLHRARLNSISQLKDDLPQEILDKRALTPIVEAIQLMHYPDTMVDAHNLELLPAHMFRIVYEEFFKFQLQMLWGKVKFKENQAKAFAVKNLLAQKIRAQIPFQLTNGQEVALSEIQKDLQSNCAMNRILQGDVGCGKTLVALLAIAEALDNQFQAALMAPTEILAEQLAQEAQKLFADTDKKLAFLSGALSASQKKQTQQKIRTGEIDFVIGTHALIQENVSWYNLGLVVIDEQHRFGVGQRAFMQKANSEGNYPHFLTMSATPIPRSLALTIYGEQKLSSIDELPKQRKAVRTKVLQESERQKALNLIAREIGRGHQAYLVYPLVGESEAEAMQGIKNVEQEFAKLKQGPMSKFRIAMLHGQMKNEERIEIMQDFRAGKYDILCATTVIEVGVDVPNTTVIVIENAERFGLSQLHQLRGRVGRSEFESFCVLITNKQANTFVPNQNPGFFSDEAEEDMEWDRLTIMEKYQDGFKIAEADLKLRGPGEFFGLRQSGSPSFKIANLVRDTEIMNLARADALELFERDPELKRPEHARLRANCIRIANQHPN